MTLGLLLSYCSASPSQQPLSSWSRLVHHQQAHIPPREGKDCPFFIKSGPMVVHILSTYGPLPPPWQNLLLLRGHLDLPPTTQRSMAPLQFQGCILTGLNQALQSSIPLSGRGHTWACVSDQKDWRKTHWGLPGIISPKIYKTVTNREETPRHPPFTGSVKFAYRAWNHHSHLDPTRRLTWRVHKRQFSLTQQQALPDLRAFAHTVPSARNASPRSHWGHSSTSFRSPLKCRLLRRTHLTSLPSTTLFCCLFS